MKLWIVCLCLMALSGSLKADVPQKLPGVRVARVFADNMVLQREKPVKIWGWAKSGVKVAVGYRGGEGGCASHLVSSISGSLAAWGRTV